MEHAYQATSINLLWSSDPSIFDMILIIIHLRLQPHLPGANKLKNVVRRDRGFVVICGFVFSEQVTTFDTTSSDYEVGLMKTD